MLSSFVLIFVIAYDDHYLKEIGDVPHILATSKTFWDKVFYTPLVAKYWHWSGLLIKF